MDVVYRKFLAIVFLAVGSVSCLQAMKPGRNEPEYLFGFYSNSSLGQNASAEEIAERMKNLRSSAYGCPKTESYKIMLKDNLDPLQRRFDEAYDKLTRWWKVRYFVSSYRRPLAAGAGLTTLLAATYAAHAKGYDRSAWNHTYGVLPESLQNRLEQAAKHVCRFFVYSGRKVINKTVEVSGRVQKALEETE